MGELSWLGVLRHGESEGNVAADRAEATGSETIDIDVPDADVVLSDTGRQQAEAVGRWFRALPAEQKPTVVFASTYRRASHTAELAAAGLTGAAAVRHDERLRDRELGVLDRLTALGVSTRLPDEDARRRFLGKFYYRPPGGESWADVALRLRSLLADLAREHQDQRVLLVTHEAVIFLLRYLIDGLSVEELLGLAPWRLANASLTSWERRDGKLALVAFDDDSPIRAQALTTRQNNATPP
jgi:broad specificity phosphatase PhoE